MEIYDCKVLIGGSRSNEVRKQSIPAPEILMLRHIHGDDSVIDVKHVGTSQLSNKEVRDLLTLSYGPGDVDTTRAGPAILREVFGPPGVPLPLALDGVELLEKKKVVKPEHVKRWRDMRPEEELNAPASEPAFAD